MGKPKWTYEIVSKLAKECFSRYDFQKKHKNAYNAAWSNGWLDDFFNETRKSIGYWDVYENVYKEAKKVSSKKDFRKLNEVAYRSALKHNWLSTFDWFINLQSSICTFEHCSEKAKLCHSVREFRMKFNNEYNHSRVNNWLPKFFLYKNGRPAVTQPRPIKLTREYCFDCAKQCSYASEMIKRFASAYGKARQHGWLKDYTWFKTPQLTVTNNKEKVFCIYVYMDNINRVCYVGLTKDLKRRHRQHKSPNKRGCLDIVAKYFTSIGNELPAPILIEDNLTAEEAQEREAYFIRKYSEEEYNCLNIAQPGSIGSVGYKWTKEACFTEARKYDLYNDFITKSPSCASACRKYGWLSEFTWLKRQLKQWTNEECLAVARQYQYIDDFSNERKDAYDYAKSHRLLDEIRLFLKYKTTHWTDDTVRTEALKYTKYNDFYKASISAFNYAKRNGLLESFTWLKKAERITDIEICFKKAKEYTTMIEFKTNCPKEYQYISNKKRLNELIWLSRRNS